MSAQQNDALAFLLRCKQMLQSMQKSLVAQFFPIIEPAAKALDDADAVGLETVPDQFLDRRLIQLRHTMPDVLSGNFHALGKDQIGEAAKTATQRELDTQRQVRDQPRHSKAQPRRPVLRCDESAITGNSGFDSGQGWIL